jgi:hypothetical protein
MFWKKEKEGISTKKNQKKKTQKNGAKHGQVCC